MACKTKLGLDVLKRSSTSLNLTLNNNNSETKRKQCDSNTILKSNVKWSQIVDVLQKSHTFMSGSDSNDNHKINKSSNNDLQTSSSTKTTESSKSVHMSRNQMSPWLMSKCSFQQTEQEMSSADIERKHGRGELMLCVAKTEMDRIRSNCDYLQTWDSNNDQNCATGKKLPRNRCKQTPLIHVLNEKDNMKEQSNIPTKNANGKQNCRENVYVMESPLISARGTSIFPAVSGNKNKKDDKSIRTTLQTHHLQDNNSRSSSNNSRSSQRLGLVCDKKILHPKGKCNWTNSDSPVSPHRKKSPNGSKRKTLTVNVSFSFMDEVFEFDSHRPIYSTSSDNQISLS